MRFQAVATSGALAASGALMVVTTALPWLDSDRINVLYLFGVPAGRAGPGGNSVTVDGFDVRGLSTGSGQIVLGAGVALVVIAVAALRSPRVRRLGWLAMVPGIVAAGAVGHWQRSVGHFSPLHQPGWSLAALAAAGVSIAAAAMLQRRTPAAARLAALCGGLVVAMLSCGIFAVIGAQTAGASYVLGHVPAPG